MLFVFIHDLKATSETTWAYGALSYLVLGYDIQI